MKIERVWAMPNKWTFRIKPIQELLERYNVGEGWIDPFAGMASPAEHIYTNDKNPKCDAKWHLDAEFFLKMWDPVDCQFKGCLLDPPYSWRQLFETYHLPAKELRGKKIPLTIINDLVKDRIEGNGYVITFGWNSNGLGAKRGFVIREILLVAHGGQHNDTIVTVEQKV